MVRSYDLESETVGCVCGKLLKYDSEDIHKGGYGDFYITCPFCKEEVLIKERESSLNFRELNFPVHFHCFKDGYTSTNAHLTTLIKNTINKLENGSNNSNYKVITFGKYFIFVEKLPYDKEYRVMVTDNYYQSFCVGD